jgi:hypothetical protein
VLSKVTSYAHLGEVAADLGTDLVIQGAFGDSGNTTWFVSNEKEYDKYAEDIESEPEVKIMKRVNVRGSAIEACTTKQGTIVGPLMTELVGFKELTPKKGGWCGNEIFPGSFTQDIQCVALPFGDRMSHPQMARIRGMAASVHEKLAIAVHVPFIEVHDPGIALKRTIRQRLSMPRHIAFDRNLIAVLQRIAVPAVSLKRVRTQDFERPSNRFPSASLTSTYMYACGLTHDSLRTVPFTVTGLFESYSAAKE